MCKVDKLETMNYNFKVSNKGNQKMMKVREHDID